MFYNLKRQKRKQRGYCPTFTAPSSPPSASKKGWRACDLNASCRWNLTGPDQYFPSNKLYWFQQNKAAILKYMVLSEFKCYRWHVTLGSHHDYLSTSVFLISGCLMRNTHSYCSLKITGCGAWESFSAVFLMNSTGMQAVYVYIQAPAAKGLRDLELKIS